MGLLEEEEDWKEEQLARSPDLMRTIRLQSQGINKLQEVNNRGRNKTQCN